MSSSLAKRMTWFHLDPSRWLTDVRWMSPTTSHAYTIITMLALEREEPLPEDHKRLAKYAGMAVPSFRKALTELIEDGIVWQAEGGLMTDFVAQEIEFRDQKRGKSKKAANIRWGKKPTKTKDDGYARNADGMPLEENGERREERERPKGRDPQRPPSTSEAKGKTPRRSPAGAPRVSYRVGQIVEILGVGELEVESTVDFHIIARAVTDGERWSIPLDDGGYLVDADAERIGLDDMLQENDDDAA